MSLAIIQERLASYGCRSTIEEEQALREITQEIVLAALGRTDFFERSGFQGGTCLRIFHRLDRFSEDLDFALEAPDPSFQLGPYLAGIDRELDIFGYSVEIEDRSRGGAEVRQAFVKDDSIGKLLRLDYPLRTGSPKKLKIKLEVDTNPPAGASYEMPVLDYPFPSAVRVFDLPSLFAGKMHALLCRIYPKGRDWYDFVWYTARGVSVNHRLLGAALDQQGPWKGTAPDVDDSWCIEQLETRIARLDWGSMRRDVQRFVKPHERASLDLWTPEFFLRQAVKLGGREGLR